MKNRKALVVLSGGQDSTTCLFWAIDKFGKENVSAIGLTRSIINQLSANSLTREDIPVEETKPEGAPPNTFVEGRNLLFLSYAAIYAKTHGITDLVTGVCETDFSGYPDCRDIFVKSLNVTINLAMDYNFVIHTPLMWLNKAETWKMADDLGVLDTIYNETLTCYNGVLGEDCGHCPSCTLRRRGYEQYMEMKKCTK